MLYNDCWHGFWAGSWWSRVLWQAVMLRLVNRGMAVHRGRPVEQVYNRKETMWYENYAVRFRQSIHSESRVEPGIRSRSEASLTSLTIRLARECKRWLQKEDMGQKEVYVSPSISQTYIKLCAPFKNKIREVYFYFSFVHWSSFIFFVYVLGWVYEKYTTISRLLVGGVLPLCRDAAGVFYSPSQLSNRRLEEELRPYRPEQYQNCQGYSEKSWKSKEIWCHSVSS